MNTITVVSYASMPGRFRVMGAGPIKTCMERDAGDPGEAAAVALQYARVTPKPWVIIGPKVVMDFLPHGARCSND
jgi:hypothetical protein